MPPFPVTTSPLAQRKLAIIHFFLDLFLMAGIQIATSKVVPSTHKELVDATPFPFLLVPKCDLDASLLELKPNPDGTECYEFGGLVCVGRDLFSVNMNPLFEGFFPLLRLHFSALMQYARSYSPYSAYINEQKKEIFKTFSQLRDYYSDPAVEMSVASMCEWAVHITIVKEVFGVSHKAKSVEDDENEMGEKETLADITGSSRIQEILAGTSALSQNLQTFFMKVQITQALPSYTILKMAMSEEDAEKCHSLNVFAHTLPRARVLDVSQITSKGFYFLPTYKVMVPFDVLLDLAFKAYSVRIMIPDEPVISKHPIFKTTPIPYHGVIHLLDNLFFIIQPSTVRTIPFKGILTTSKSNDLALMNSNPDLLLSQRSETQEEEHASLVESSGIFSDFSQNTDFLASDTATESFAWSSVSHTEDSMIDNEKEVTHEETKIFSLANMGVPAKILKIAELVNRRFGGSFSQHQFLKNLMNRWITFMTRLDILANKNTFIGLVSPRGFLPMLTFDLLSTLFTEFTLNVSKMPMRSFNFNYGTQILFNAGSGQKFIWGQLQEEIHTQQLNLAQGNPPIEHKAEKEVFFTNHIILTKQDSINAYQKFNTLYNNTQLQNPFIFDMIRPHFIHFLFSDSPEFIKSIVPCSFPVLEIVEPQIEVLVLSIVVEWATRTVRKGGIHYEIGRGTLFSLALRSCRSFVFPFLLEPCSKILNIVSSFLLKKDFVYVIGTQFLKFVLGFLDALIIGVTPQIFRSITQDQINTIIVFCFFWVLASYSTVKNQFVEGKGPEKKAFGFQLKSSWSTVWDSFTQNETVDDDNSEEDSEDDSPIKGLGFSIPKLETGGMMLGTNQKSSLDPFLEPFKNLKERILREIKSSAPVSDSPLSWFPIFFEKDGDVLVMKLENWEEITKIFFCYDEEEEPSSILITLMPYFFMALIYIHERNNIIVPNTTSTPLMGNLFFEIIVRIFSLRHNKHIKGVAQTAAVEKALQFSKDLHLVYLSLAIVPKTTFPSFEPEVSNMKTITFTSLDLNMIATHKRFSVSSHVPDSLCKTRFSSLLEDDFMEVFEPSIKGETLNTGVSTCDPMITNNGYHFMLFGETANTFLRRESLPLFQDVTFQNITSMGQVPLRDGYYIPNISFTEVVFLPTFLSQFHYMRHLLFHKGVLFPPLPRQLFAALLDNEFSTIFELFEDDGFNAQVVADVIFEIITTINDLSKQLKFATSEFFSIMSFLQAYVDEETTVDDFCLFLYHSCIIVLANHPDMDASLKKEIEGTIVAKILSKQFPEISMIANEFNSFFVFFKAKKPHQNSRDPYADVIIDLGHTFRTVRSNPNVDTVSGIRFVGSSINLIFSNLAQLWDTEEEVKKHFSEYKLEVQSIQQLEEDWFFMVKTFIRDSLFAQNLSFTESLPQMRVFFKLVQRLFTPVKNISPIGPLSNGGFSQEHDPILAPRSGIFVSKVTFPFLQILQAATSYTTGYMPFILSRAFPENILDGLEYLMSFILDVYTFVAWTGEIAVVYIPDPVSTYSQYFSIFEDLIKYGLSAKLFDVLNEEQLDRLETFFMLSPLLSNAKKIHIGLPWLLLNSGLLDKVRFVIHLYDEGPGKSIWKQKSARFWKNSYVVSFETVLSMEDSQHLISSIRSNTQKIILQREERESVQVASDILDTTYVTIPYQDEIKRLPVEHLDMDQFKTTIDILKKMPHIFSTAGKNQKFLTSEELESMVRVVFHEYIVMGISTVFNEISKVTEIFNLTEAHIYFYKLLSGKIFGILDHISTITLVSKHITVMLDNANALTNQYKQAKTSISNNQDVLERMFVGICHGQIQLEKRISSLEENNSKLLRLRSQISEVQEQKQSIVDMEKKTASIVISFADLMDERDLQQTIHRMKSPPVFIVTVMKALVFALTTKLPDDSNIIPILQAFTKNIKKMFALISKSIENQSDAQDDNLRFLSKNFYTIAKKAYMRALPTDTDQAESALIPSFKEDLSMFVPYKEEEFFTDAPDIPENIRSFFKDCGLAVSAPYRPIFQQMVDFTPKIFLLYVCGMFVLQQTHTYFLKSQVDTRLGSLGRNEEQLVEQNKSLQESVRETQVRISEDKAAHADIECQCNQSIIDLKDLEDRMKIANEIQSSTKKMQQSIEVLMKEFEYAGKTAIGDVLLALIVYGLFPHYPPNEIQRLTKITMKIMVSAGLHTSEYLTEIATIDSNYVEDTMTIAKLDVSTFKTLNFHLAYVLHGSRVMNYLNHEIVKTFGTVTFGLWRNITLQYTFPYTTVITVASHEHLDHPSIIDQIHFVSQITAKQSSAFLFAFNEFKDVYPATFRTVDITDSSISAGKLFESIIERARECENDLFKVLSKSKTAKKLLDGTIQFSIPSMKEAAHFMLPVVLRLYQPIKFFDGLLPFLDHSYCIEWCPSTKSAGKGSFLVDSEVQFHYKQILPNLMFSHTILTCPIKLIILTTNDVYKQMTQFPIFSRKSLSIPVTPLGEVDLMTPEQLTQFESAITNFKTMEELLQIIAFGDPDELSFNKEFITKLKSWNEM
eukprot:gnl/Chilomastix_cuspidata/7779.p1 GENE.gnl/Chilomastix_cuspidata/7779~~gnl/Chilomastix_cuspidata/7779.p1  ORF type:complete len:2911 (+),score=373.27 gnl/Chilomastix_cuspidata/7779:1173-8735(+)